MRTIVEQINQAMVTMSRNGLVKIEEMSRDYMAINEKLLFEIIKQNKDTEYGKKYDFASIKTIEDYAKNVPITNYDDYAPYIEQMSEVGVDNLICAKKITHFNKTSGTLGVPKRIPIDLDEYRKISALSYSVIAQIYDTIDNSFADKKTVQLIEVSGITKLSSGATFGAVSAVGMAERFKQTGSSLTSPIEALMPSPETNTRYIHARFALESGDEVGNITSAFLSYTVEFMRYIENNWEMLVDDIKNGTINEDVQMSEDTRASLLTKISPNLERASELSRIFAEGFDTPIAPKIWKNLVYVSGCGTASFAFYKDLLVSRYLGDSIQIALAGYGASEGYFATPIKANDQNAVVLPASAFLEFLPFDAEKETQPVTLDKLEIGKKYIVIITNCSGFYRYNMGDVVEVTGKYNGCPTIVFLYRAEQTVSIMGEKTTAIAVQKCVMDTAKEAGFDVVDFSLYPNVNAAPVRYDIYIEKFNDKKNLSLEATHEILEKKLALANPSMGDKVKKGVCGKTVLHFLQPETYALYRDMMVHKGISSAQLKPIHIIKNETQKNFLHALRED